MKQEELKEVGLNFEQELYKAFGQVKDFTLGMRIARHFFELGLRGQNRWKPSDMELEVLRLAAEKDGTCLMGLYENLKKLREE